MARLIRNKNTTVKRDPSIWNLHPRINWKINYDGRITGKTHVSSRSVFTTFPIHLKERNGIIGIATEKNLIPVLLFRADTAHRTKRAQKCHRPEKTFECFDIYEEHKWLWNIRRSECRNKSKRDSPMIKLMNVLLKENIAVENIECLRKKIKTIKKCILARVYEGRETLSPPKLKTEDDDTCLRRYLPERETLSRK